MKTGKITATALLLSLSFALSLLEWLVPIGAVIPVPGLKLGIANIAVMAAHIYCGKKSAFCVAVLRPLMTFLLFGNPTSFILSLTGGFVSFVAQILVIGLYGKLFSYGGISVICAVVHGIGQMAAAVFVVSDTSVLYYLPVLCAASALTGLLNGYIMNLLFCKILPHVLTGGKTE